MALRDRIELFKRVSDGTYWYVNAKGAWQQLLFATGSELYGLYSQTSNSTTVVNTTTEKSIVGAGLGTLTVPANGFKVGDSFHAKIGGVIRVINNNDLTIRIKSGSVELATTGLITLAGATDKPWEIEMDFTIRSIGTTKQAEIVTSGQFVMNKDGGNQYEGNGFNSLNNETFNTTIANTLDVTVQWASASEGNSIYSTSLILYKTF